MTEEEIEESHSTQCGINGWGVSGWYGPCDCIVKELKDAKARIEELEAGIEAHSCGISKGCYCTFANDSAEHDPGCQGGQPFKAERDLKALIE